MMFKRVVIFIAVMLMLTGMAVSTTAEYAFDVVVGIGTSVACEATSFENTTTQTPVAFDADMSAFQTTNLTAKTTVPATTMKMVKNTENPVKASEVIAVTEPVELPEKVEEKQDVEVAKAEEMQEEQEAKPLEEGTIVDPNVDVNAIVLEEYTWDGEVLDSYNGTVKGPNGKETYYNLDMTGVIWIMENLGYDYEYRVREDGVKMYGPFIMVAADLNLRPRGSIIKTSLGWAMVCDTGGFTQWNPTQLDIATAW